MEEITVYGSADCEDTDASRAQLDQLSVKYRYVDVDEDQEASTYAAGLNQGRLKTPTITFEGGGDPLIEPSSEELVAELQRRQLVPGREGGSYVS